jgi:ribonuclease P protein component
MLRVGIAIGKPVGKAVQRNLVRRRIQGALDSVDVSRATQCDILIVAKPGAAALSYTELAQQLLGGLREPLQLQARIAPASAGTLERRPVGVG